MTLAGTLVSAVLAALLVFAAIRKLSHRPEVVASYARVGVPEERLDQLALLLLAAAAGLLAGLAWEPLGVLAATATVCYFAVAIAFHVRAADLAHLPTPLMIELLAGAALALSLAA